MIEHILGDLPIGRANEAIFFELLGGARSQRSPSQRVDEPRRALSAVTEVC